MIKNELWEICVAKVKSRLAEVELGIAAANEALQDETKSSAGDKYETSREMIQQDLNRYQQQLTLANQDLAVLEKVMDMPSSAVVTVGSLIHTQAAIYYVTVSIGAVKLENKQVFVVSPKSPIGKELMGKSSAETFSFNGREDCIVRIV